jgi:hypothetical protein
MTKTHGQATFRTFAWRSVSAPCVVSRRDSNLEDFPSILVTLESFLIRRPLLFRSSAVMDMS